MGDLYVFRPLRWHSIGKGGSFYSNSLGSAQKNLHNDGLDENYYGITHFEQFSIENNRSVVQEIYLE